ncbi:ComF family protein [Vibrio stylophorae]|nr:ComF family protein [Vibrio stylophorae]
MPILSTVLCGHCQPLLAQRSRCMGCALPLPVDQIKGGLNLCGGCLKRPPIWQRMTVAGEYHGIWASLLAQYKFERRFWLAQPLSASIPVPSERPDWLMPVPMHWKKRWLRGFNQSTHLAWQLSDRWQIPLWQGIRCCRYTATQHQLNAQSRRRNLKQAYQLKGAVPKAHIGIVDDIVTTGTTVSELAKLLRRHGATQISVYAVARTPPPSDSTGR